jgi:hypothetical protein
MGITLWLVPMSRPFRANPNIANPTDPQEKATGQITNSRAIPSVKATTHRKIFVAFRVVRG